MITQQSLDIKFRDGEIDLALCAGPRIREWPTQGARFLTRWCSDFGIKVGWYGGLGQKVRGVMPEGTSGGVVWVEDLQKRVHRIRSKAVVRIDPILHLPQPFSGWYSPGLIPESTAKKLIQQANLHWEPVVYILGTGNRALRLGTDILQKRLATRVVCVESVFQQVQGWEVEYRRFLMTGGQVLFAKPIALKNLSPVSWQFNHTLGTEEVSRVISVGPFEEDLGFQEYPQGSLLAQWQNAESENFVDNVESMMLDEQRAIVLAVKLIKGLGVTFSSEQKGFLDRALWTSKQKLKELELASQTFSPFEFDGKWLSADSKKKMLAFPGIPQKLDQSFKAGKVMAAIDCIQCIACRICERECPANAIQINRLYSEISNASSINTSPLECETKSFLLEDQCTGCGRCVQVCPSQVPVMFEGGFQDSFSTLILSYREKTKLRKSEKVSLINRQGEVLATSRIIDVFVDAETERGDIPLYKVEVPSHLVWDVRGIIPLALRPEVEHADDFYREQGERVEVQIEGVTRRVREGQLLSAGLFEIGVARPNDILMCEDGSCGLCQIDVDGIRKLACQCTLHRGMSIRYVRAHEASGLLCPCKGISVESETEKLQQSSRYSENTHASIDAAVRSSEVGTGRCHGALCGQSHLRLYRGLSTPVGRFARWDFPWTDWPIG